MKWTSNLGTLTEQITIARKLPCALKTTDLERGAFVLLERSELGKPLSNNL
jgi:hypothetical protein